MGTNYTRYNRPRLRGMGEPLVNHGKRIAVMAMLLVAGAVLLATAAAGQANDARQEALLKRLFPAATAFSPKGGDPPHFKALAGDGRTLLGLAFWTTEL